MQSKAQSILAIVAVGGWVVAAIGLYCAQFNARLCLKWKKLYQASEARAEQALEAARDAVGAAGAALEKRWSSGEEKTHEAND